MHRYQFVEAWTEENLDSIPESENDVYEYKSSLIRDLIPKSYERYKNSLREKIYRAASAFWNTGGGIFIVGVADNTGKIDGGVPRVIGKQKIRDWVDQVLAEVEPGGEYSVKVIEREKPDSLIEPDNVVLVIGFGESYTLPHMAPDNRYYVRAGAHTVAAGHYLVESMRSRRGLNQPMLRGLLKVHESKEGVIELVVLPLNETPALNVSINLDPIPNTLASYLGDKLPLKIPVIDQRNPFRMDMTTFRLKDEMFGETPVYLEIEYHDLIGKQFNERQLIDPHRSVNTHQINMAMSTSLKKSLDKMYKEMRRLRRMLEQYMVDSK